MYCFSYLCFVCLNTEENLQSITTTDTDKVPFLDKFKYCNFRNAIADNPTSAMCRSCIESLKTAYKFKKICESSNSVFIKYLELDQMVTSDTIRNVSLKTMEAFVQQHQIKIEPDYDGETDITEELETEEVSSILHNFKNELVASTKTNCVKTSSCKVPKINIKDKLVSSLITDIPKSNSYSLPQSSIKTELPYSVPILSDSLNRNEISSVELSESNSTSLGLRIKTDLPHLVGVTSNGALRKWPEVESQATSEGFDKSKEFESIFLKEELESGVNNIGDDLMCRFCTKVFRRKTCLKKHMYTHSGEKLHHCSICKKNFSLKSNLKTHLLIHTGVRPHKCDVCNKCFSHKSNLYTHRLVHTGEKKHQCSICCKSFTKKSNYKTHMIIHTEERPHICKECSKSFRMKSHLKRHMLTH